MPFKTMKSIVLFLILNLKITGCIALDSEVVSDPVTTAIPSEPIAPTSIPSQQGGGDDIFPTVSLDECNDGALWAGSITTQEKIEQFNMTMVDDNNGIARHYTRVEQNISVIANDTLLEMTMPRLCEVGGSVKIDSNVTLLSVSFPKFVSMGGLLSFQHNQSLESILLPELVSVSFGAAVINNDSLDVVSMPQLTTVYDFFVVNFNNALHTLVVSSLETVGGDLQIADNGLLESISLPNLRSVGLEDNASFSDISIKITQDPMLVSIALPNLETVRNAIDVLTDNPILNECDLGFYQARCM